MKFILEIECDSLEGASPYTDAALRAAEYVVEVLDANREQLLMKHGPWTLLDEDGNMLGVARFVDVGE